ncbi:hypothetical protein NN561_000378 [Cricetulus griseus]
MRPRLGRSWRAVRARAGRDATRVEAPSERRAANVSAASLCGRRAGQARGRWEPACVRSSLCSRVSWKRWPRLLPPACKPRRRQRNGRRCEGETLPLGGHLLPRPSRGISGFSKIGPGHRVAQLSNPLPGAPGVERTQIVGGPPPPSRFHASITPGRGPKGHWRPAPDTLAPSPQARSFQP